MTSPFLHIWQTERSILFRKDKAFKWFILLCNYNYVQQKTRKHRRGQGRIALLIRRILSNWNKKHTHSICTFQKNIIIIIISQNVETLLFPNTHQNLATKKPSKNTKTKNTGKPSPPTTQLNRGRGFPNENIGDNFPPNWTLGSSPRVGWSTRVGHGDFGLKKTAKF